MSGGLQQRYSLQGGNDRTSSSTAAQYPELSLRILTVGLGVAYTRALNGEAALVASATALEAASHILGAPPPAELQELQLPLFGCPQLQLPPREGEHRAQP